MSVIRAIMSTRGRPAKIDKDRVVNILLKYKDQIMQDNGKIVSKCDKIWIIIAKDLENCLTPISLYAIVICNRYKIREKLCD